MSMEKQYRPMFNFANGKTWNGFPLLAFWHFSIRIVHWVNYPKMVELFRLVNDDSRKSHPARYPTKKTCKNTMFLCPVYRLGLVFPGGRWRCDPRSCWAAISPGDGWALTHPRMAMGYLGCRWDGGVKALKMEVSTRTMEGFVGMISPIARWFFCRFSPSEDLIYCLLLKFPHYSTWIIQSAVFS